MATPTHSAAYQARLSTLVAPREGRCLNVMDAQAHANQAQHRNRYAHVSMEPMRKRFSAFAADISNANRFTEVPQSAY